MFACQLGNIISMEDVAQLGNEMSPDSKNTKNFIDVHNQISLKLNSPVTLQSSYRKGRNMQCYSQLEKGFG